MDHWDWPGKQCRCTHLTAHFSQTVNPFLRLIFFYILFKYPFFCKIVHLLCRQNRIFVDMSYFLKTVVLSPILSTKRLSTTALINRISIKKWVIWSLIPWNRYGIDTSKSDVHAKESDIEESEDNWKSLFTVVGIGRASPHSVLIENRWIVIDAIYTGSQSYASQIKLIMKVKEWHIILPGIICYVILR